MILDSLESKLDKKVSTNQYVLEEHGRDENFPNVNPPLAVVFAETVADIQTTLSWAHETKIPVIAFGTGTSFEGQVVPQGPAISLDLSRMNHILRISPADFFVEVEPGVTRTALNEALRQYGLFFPVDPGANASLGGMAATNASGTTTVKYGGMRPNILSLEVVLANGEILHLGRPVRKTSSGYDLKDLFIGSGGTLGIITRLVLSLHPVPDCIHTLRVFFPDLQAAIQAAYNLMASSLSVARLELVDEMGIETTNKVLGLSFPLKPALFIEFHSSTQEATAAEAELAKEIVLEAGASEIAVARTTEERDEQWEARHKIYWSLVNRFPGHRYTITDTAVPLSRIAELVLFSQQLLQEMRLDGCIVGHVGDGNFHTIIATKEEDYNLALEFSEQLVTHALALGGTASGEHGIGLIKRKFMEEEHGSALAWMRQIKTLFDPENLLNPGKIFNS